MIVGNTVAELLSGHLKAAPKLSDGLIAAY